MSNERDVGRALVALQGRINKNLQYRLESHKGPPCIFYIGFLKNQIIKKGGKKISLSGYHFHFLAQIDDLIIVKTLFK